MRHVVVMITTSYPRFPGDGVGSFIEPIAKSVAARGHEVHLVAPWHPAITRGKVEDGVFFHFYRYAPIPAMNVFGYAEGLEADTHLRLRAWAAAPAAMATGWFKAWRVATKRQATVIHAHWVVPNGVLGLCAAGRRPLILSLHGSDVFVAERYALAGRAARTAFRKAAWTTACSDDLRTRALALGARPSTTETVPYGVDTVRFRPHPEARTAARRALGISDGPFVFSAGRLVEKKGFAFLVDAAAPLAATFPELRIVIAGDGDLRDELQGRAAGLPSVSFVGARNQDEVARLAAAADVVVLPSVHDKAGNVDGLPNFALEAMAAGAAVVATAVGGLPGAIEDQVSGRLVPERDAAALAAAIGDLLANPARAHDMGQAARARVERNFSWARVADRLTLAYDRSVGAPAAS